MKKRTLNIKSDQISSIILLFFGLFIIFQAKELGVEARFIPRIVASLIIIFSVLVFVQSSTIKKVDILPIKQKHLDKKLVFVIFLTVVYMFIMPIIGFEIASFCYLLFLIGLLEKQFLWSSVLISVIVIFALVIIFYFGMDLRIPLLFTKLFNL